MAPLALRLFLGIGSAIILAGCSRPSFRPSTATGKRTDALAAFTATVEPEVQRLLDTEIYASSKPITWTAPVSFGMQESANPMSVDNPYARQDRVIRVGKLPDGAEIIAEGLYSYQKKRLISISVIIDYPRGPGPAPKGNVAIDKTLLAGVGLSSSLTTALLAGLGNGSMSSSAPITYQAMASIGGKRFEATTAVHRGKPLKLELSCLYFK